MSTAPRVHKFAAAAILYEVRFRALLAKWIIILTVKSEIGKHKMHVSCFIQVKWLVWCNSIPREQYMPLHYKKKTWGTASFHTSSKPVGHMMKNEKRKSEMTHSFPHWPSLRIEWINGISINFWFRQSHSLSVPHHTTENRKISAVHHTSKQLGNSDGGHDSDKLTMQIQHATSR